jgi:hypothetical protein
MGRNHASIGARLQMKSSAPFALTPARARGGGVGKNSQLRRENTIKTITTKKMLAGSG